MSSDPWGTLSKVRDMGLKYVELAGMYDHSAAEVKSKLDELGLKVSASHCGLNQLEDSFDQTIADHKTLCCSNLVVPWISPDEWDSTFSTFQSRMGAMGKRVREAGLSLAFHNHGHEMLHGKIGEFFDGLPASDVHAQFDLGWVFYAKEDPVTWLKRYSGRIDSVHIKDMDMQGDSPDAIAGKGLINWDPILAACLEDPNIQYAAIEMDNPPGDPVDAVRQCVDYFRGKGLSQ